MRTALRAGAQCLVLSLMVGACGTSQVSSQEINSSVDSLLMGELWKQPQSLGTDIWEVVVCHVPLDIRDAMYAQVAARLTLTGQDIVAQLSGVTDYFGDLSGGAYKPVFTSGADLNISSAETSQQCVHRALDQSAPSAQGVLVIADAQHSGLASGGWGNPGKSCTEKCSAYITRRAVYIGAGDFMPYWNANPPLDLLEHEIGHALGWPHSTRSSAKITEHIYDSDLDVMSNSLAPRLADPSRRHAQRSMGINVLQAGWLPRQKVHIVTAVPSEVRVADRTSGTLDAQLLILPITDDSFVTIEFISAIGYNDYLSRSGVGIHLVEWGKLVCSASVDDAHCATTDRRQTLMTSPDSDDGLLGEKDSVIIGGYRIVVQEVSDNMFSKVTIARISANA